MRDAKNGSVWKKTKKELQKQEQKKTVILCAIILLILFGVIGVMALREMASNEETEPSEVTQNVIFSKDGEEKLNEEQIENENQTEVKNDEDKYDYDLICRWMSKSTTQTYYYFDFNAGIVTELSITTKKGSTDVKSVEGPKTGELSGNMQNGWTYGMYEFRCEERNGENRVIMYVNGNEHADSQRKLSPI